VGEALVAERAEIAVLEVGHGVTFTVAAEIAERALITLW
jgi:hypothetical protein